MCVGYQTARCYTAVYPLLVESNLNPRISRLSISFLKVWSTYGVLPDKTNYSLFHSFDFFLYVFPDIFLVFECFHASFFLVFYRHLSFDQNGTYHISLNNQSLQRF